MGWPREWADGELELLMQLWAKGYSCSQIAKELHQALRVDRSRNAVIGKVHRLGLAGRVSPSRPPRRQVPRPSPKRARREPQPPKAYVMPFWQARSAELDAIRAMAAHPLPDGRLAQVHDLREGLCHFPIGDPGAAGFAFCARVSAVGPYCCDHARLCYGDADAAARRALRREEKRRAETRMVQELKRLSGDSAFAAMR